MKYEYMTTDDLKSQVNVKRAAHQIYWTNKADEGVKIECRSSYVTHDRRIIYNRIGNYTGNVMKQYFVSVVVRNNPKREKDFLP